MSGLLLGRRGLLRLGQAALLVTGRGAVEAGTLTGRGIVLLYFRESFLGGLGGGGASGFADFARDFGAFGGYFLSQRAAVKLQETFDFVVAVVLVVKNDKAFGDLVDVEILFVAGDDGVDEGLAVFVVLNGDEQALAVLFSGGFHGILNLVVGADEFEQGADIRFFHGIDRRGRRDGLGGGLLRSLSGDRGRTLDGHQEGADVNHNQSQSRFHDRSLSRRRPRGEAEPENQ